MLLLFKEGKAVPFAKPLVLVVCFFNFTNKLHRVSAGAWEICALQIQNHRCVLYRLTG